MNNNRSTASLIICIIIIIAIAVLVWIGYKRTPSPAPAPAAPAASSTMALDHSTSDGSVIISYPGEGYGFATDPAQVLAKAYIPPCDQEFTYCIYYNGTAYQGTNFESAGLKIQKRPDLATERLCLNTPPSGYDSSVQPDATTTAKNYSSSEFASVGDAGAGHYASGSLYRLFYRATSGCYEFQTRIGQTQFANYPAGSIKEFTAADMAAVKAQLATMLEHVTLQTGESQLFAH